MRRYTLLLIVVLTTLAGKTIAVNPKWHKPKYPDVTKMYRIAVRGNSTEDKISSSLRMLCKQYSTGRGTSHTYYTPMQIRSRFGVSSELKDPCVGVAVSLKPGSGQDEVKSAGLLISERMGDTLYGYARVSTLKRIAGEGSVVSIDPVKAARLPRPASSIRPRIIPTAKLQIRGDTPKQLNEFDHHGLTGKNVVVGIIDSGIDWRHADFRNEDGTTRLLYIYDMTDDSFNKSGGKTGREGPVTTLDEHGKVRHLGTLYTRDQINAALSGNGKVESKDAEGHGTACASTAAGNGRAGGKDKSKKFLGVAPEADLIAVKTDADGEGLPLYDSAVWVAKTARSLNKPCVMNMSFGTQDCTHDGSEQCEKILNDMCGAGKPGLAVCAAAGNEAMTNTHAMGVFGPKAEGQGDIESDEIELFASKETWLAAYFYKSDDWGLVVGGLDNFFVDKSGNPSLLYLSKSQGKVAFKFSDNIATPADPIAYCKQYVSKDEVGKFERVEMRLPAGKYVLLGFGSTKQVTNGQFHLYIPDADEASFGKGAVPYGLVCSPGNASNVIAVASYDFRSSWNIGEGKSVKYNLTPGDLSSYSSWGYRLDGVIKPEIAAPARFTISANAGGSEMEKYYKGEGSLNLIDNGSYIAWEGTSAACPYVVGVIALMLEKDPTLDADMIKSILESTARKDNFTGSVPNEKWGYGKIDPEAALSQVTSKK